MRRSLALAVVLAIALPIAAPVLEAATNHCHRVSACCIPVADHCGMKICASEPAKQDPAIQVAPITVAELVAEELSATIDSPQREHHVDPSPPPPTRLRLARLETLLI